MQDLVKTELTSNLEEHCGHQKTLPGDNWIIFAHIDRLTVSGGGVFDGQGKEAWGKNDCYKRINCAQLPIVSNMPSTFLFNLVHLVVFERVS